MKTDIELKAEAFDEFMLSMNDVDLTTPYGAGIMVASISLNAIYITKQKGKNDNPVSSSDARIMFVNNNGDSGGFPRAISTSFDWKKNPRLKGRVE